ncbi:trypsin-like peptidase domain-containing protein [Oscillospiraceae bacterium 38-13]
MGEFERTGPLPGEIVEVYRSPYRLCPEEEADPREVVEIYRSPDPREVVEVYSRPVPRRTERPSAPPPVRRRPGNGKRGLWIFLACVAVLVGLSAAARMAEKLPILPRKSHGGVLSAPVKEEITIPEWTVDQEVRLSLLREQGEPLTAQEVYRQLNPSVVTVRCRTEDGLSVGTGVVFTRDGYVITNYHVVEGGQECWVVLDSGVSVIVCYVAGDAYSDLAVLKIPPGVLQSLGDLPAAPFGDSELLVVGDPVYAIGAPRQLSGTLTNGIISAINRDVEVEGKTMTLLQTNAALNSGNSGGPLINDRGQVVGINVAKFMSGRDNNVEGLGFAIPSAQMERIINDLLKWGEVQPEPRLGIWVQTDEQGLLVKTVEDGTAAEAAGVREGDYIIAANGEEIHSNQDLFRVRRQLYVGDELTLTLRRQDEILEVTLELDEAVKKTS